MRIAFLVDKSAPYFVGGYERRVFSLAAGLARQHAVAIFTCLPTVPGVVDRVEFHSVAPVAFQSADNGERSLAHSLLFGISLVREPAALHAWAPDVVIVEAIPYVHLRTAARWLYRQSYTVILDVCEAWWNYPYSVPPFGLAGTRVIRSLLGDAAHHADHVLAISNPTRRSLIENYRVAPETVSVVPLGYTKVDAPGAPEPGAARPIDVLYLNRLVPEKRPSDLLEALRILRDQGNWSGRAVLAGGGPLAKSLAAAVRESLLAGQVEVPGFVSDERKRALFRASRVFVLPSEREGFSLTTLEAMSAGAVPIAARPALDEVFGVADLLQDGQNGVAYPVGDAGALARAIGSLLADEPRRRRMAEASALAAERYDKSRVVSELDVLLREQTARRRDHRLVAAGG